MPRVSMTSVSRFHRYSTSRSTSYAPLRRLVRDVDAALRGQARPPQALHPSLSGCLRDGTGQGVPLWTARPNAACGFLAPQGERGTPGGAEIPSRSLEWERSWGHQRARGAPGSVTPPSAWQERVGHRWRRQVLMGRRPGPAPRRPRGRPGADPLRPRSADGDGVDLPARARSTAGRMTRLRHAPSRQPPIGWTAAERWATPPPGGLKPFCSRSAPKAPLKPGNLVLLPPYPTRDRLVKPTSKITRGRPRPLTGSRTAKVLVK